MKRISLNEENFKKMINNGLIFDGVKLTKENLLDLISGEIVEIDNNLIILQDIGANNIFEILRKLKR